MRDTLVANLLSAGTKLFTTSPSNTASTWLRERFLLDMQALMTEQRRCLSTTGALVKTLLIIMGVLIR